VEQVLRILQAAYTMFTEKKDRYGTIDTLVANAWPQREAPVESMLLNNETRSSASTLRVRSRVRVRRRASSWGAEWCRGRPVRPASRPGIL